MTDQKQEAWTLTLGERMVLAARLAVLEHLRQSVTAVPQPAYTDGPSASRKVDSAFGLDPASELMGAR